MVASGCAADSFPASADGGGSVVQGEAGSPPDGAEGPGGTPNGSGSCDPGSERCACRGGNRCDPGLVCASDYCVDLGTVATGGRSSAAAGGVAGRSSTGGTPPDSRPIVEGGSGPGGTAALAGAGTEGTCSNGDTRPDGDCNQCECSEGEWQCTTKLCPDDPGIGGMGGEAGSVGSTSDNARVPCGVLQEAGHPCVAAHSTVRAIVPGYQGPLYQVCRGSYVPGPDSCPGETKDIEFLGGYVDADTQDTFCSGTICTISKIYDQSGHGNDLEPAPPGGAKPSAGNPAKAADLAVSVLGVRAYGVLFRPGQGYRKLVASRLAQNDEPETVYMVSSQADLVNGCCFDYGNAETTAQDDGNGCAEAVYLGAGVIWGTGSGGTPGPWVMADLENGLYAGWENGQDQSISTNVPLEHDFITAVLVGDTADKNGGKGRFALYGGDATSGTLKTMYDGIRPEKPGYVPMQKQGSVVLSVAGDNSDADGGRFYEGAIATGAATTATVDALQTSIVAARYRK
jgi:hypothetical protein